MSALLPLRSYQRQSLDALRDKWKTEGNRQAIVLPTGGGKTVCFAHLAAEHLRDHPGTRVLVLVHTDELVNQAYAKIRAIAPHLEAGIVKAAKNEIRADVIVASVQSLRSEKRRNAIRHVTLVIVDECHHATARTYRTIMEHYGCFGSRAVFAAGFTATLERGDGGPLGEVWSGVAFQRDIPWMIRKGYLIPPRGKRIEVPELDLRKVRTSGGDFREGDLGDALVSSLAPETIAKAFVEHAATRKAIAFLPTVASACVMREAFVDQGVTAEVLHGNLGTEDRRSILKRFAAGEVQVLVNCMILTEGFDAPEVDCVIVARPTKSKPLYIQMVGRGLRVDPARPYAEQDCLLMDVVGVSARMDLRSMADLSEKDVKPPKDGQTLLDLEDAFDLEEEGGFDPDPEEHYAGPINVKDFDPIATKSSRAWIKTSGGTYFLPAGRDAYVFLVQLPAGWAVAWSTTRNTSYVCPLRMHEPDCAVRHGKRGAVTEHQGMDLEMAMTWGEDLAVDMGADPMETLTRKAAPWRRKAATDPQKKEATRLGIKFSDAAKAGELSDRISKIKASARIDPVVGALVKQSK